MFFLSFAPGRVCWSHPVNGLQSILEACQAAAGFPEWRSHPRPGCIGRSRTGSPLVVPLQMITKDNQLGRPPKRARKNKYLRVSFQAHLAHPFLNACSTQRKGKVEIIKKNFYSPCGSTWSAGAVAHSPERPFLLPVRGVFLLVVVSPPSPTRYSVCHVCVRARLCVCV